MCHTGLRHGVILIPPSYILLNPAAWTQNPKPEILNAKFPIQASHSRGARMAVVGLEA